jgi:hypothetical protein
MTKNMILTLERLYRSKGQADWVAYSTAVALEQKGLVSAPRRQKTGGRGFPKYLVKLSTAGKAFCLRHYQRVGALENL